jgi:2-polyprenyl-3-methyl-5-hydroxy-6-metoxy-1,4-benzoquinol methylase
VIAVESDGRMKERFAAEYAGAEFLPQGIERFLERATLNPQADLIVLTDVLEHVLEPETVLTLIARALKPSGVAYITLPNADSFGDFPELVPAEAVDPDLARQTGQHLWVMQPKVINDMVSKIFDLREMSRSFESRLRRDSEYSTFLVQRPKAAPPPLRHE